MESYKPTLLEFINNMIKVKDAHNDDIWWYDYQYDVFDTIDTNDRVVILKARQMGISTMLAVYALYKALFDIGSVNVILSPKADPDRRIIRLIEAVFRTLVTKYGVSIPDIVLRTQSEIIFRNGSIISTAYAFERGDRNYHDGVLTQDFYGNYTYPIKISNLFVDEYAFFDESHIEKFNRHVGFNPNKIVISSTAHIDGDNAFYKLWKRSEKGMGEYYPIKLKWDMRPDRTEEWKIKQDQLMGTALTKREHECEFLDDVVESKHSVDDNIHIIRYPDDIKYSRFIKLDVNDGDVLLFYFKISPNLSNNVDKHLSNFIKDVEDHYKKHGKDVLIKVIPVN